MPEAVPAPRDRTRRQLLEVAAHLLRTGGPEAVTTRSVALAAGVQAPAIYRIFGDKDGLLRAVAEHGFASYVAQKRVDPDADPVEGLHAGWQLHVGFGLANPALFRLMHTTSPSADGRAAVEAGQRVLRERVRRVADAGRLRVPERRAVDLIHATGTGVVFALIEQREDERDVSLADVAWDTLCGVLLVGAGDRPAPGADVAAVTLHAALPGLGMLTPAERGLLGEWLDRINGA